MRRGPKTLFSLLITSQYARKLCFLLMRHPSNTNLTLKVSTKNSEIKHILELSVGTYNVIHFNVSSRSLHAFTQTGRRREILGRQHVETITRSCNFTDPHRRRTSIQKAFHSCRIYMLGYVCSAVICNLQTNVCSTKLRWSLRQISIFKTRYSLIRLSRPCWMFSLTLVAFKT